MSQAVLHPTAWLLTAADSIGLALLSDTDNVRRFERNAGPDLGPDRCRVWTGKRQRGTKTGGFTLYGDGCSGKGRSVSAPRFAWALRYGPIPTGHVIRNTCGTDGCSNWAHLTAVLPKGKLQIDMRQGTHPAAWELAKTACPAKHLYSPENLAAGNGSWRKCIVCRRTQQRARFARDAERILARRRELRKLKKLAALSTSNLHLIEVAS